ncbi:hypothetical protein DICVIV_04094 [Dictyocaulus viviparus]|uniref:Uncharacterized protein n=1 Tax=Dictyocaulus viviparus TaxID=29172 RepID=A0A0D8Y146_DICVI|nr:hypothetical protein DICVIV_04094 [Dictyocaulus viviparus]
MNILLKLFITIAFIQQSSGNESTLEKSYENAQSSPPMSLHQLLNAYRSLYERQFHEPLPENETILLEALPRFDYVEKKSVHHGNFDPKAFQQDVIASKVEQKAVVDDGRKNRSDVVTTATKPLSSENSTIEIKNVNGTIIIRTEATTIGQSFVKKENSSDISTTTVSSSQNVNNISNKTSIQKSDAIRSSHKLKKNSNDGKGALIIEKIAAIQTNSTSTKDDKLNNIVLSKTLLITQNDTDTVENDFSPVVNETHSTQKVSAVEMKTLERKPKQQLMKQLNKQRITVSDSKIGSQQSAVAENSNQTASTSNNLKPRTKTRSHSNLKIMNHLVVPRIPSTPVAPIARRPTAPRPRLPTENLQVILQVLLIID